MKLNRPVLMRRAAVLLAFAVHLFGTRFGLGIVSPALAQVKVGVVASATGSTSLVGIPQRNTVPLLPARAGDLSIEYIALDDASLVSQSAAIFQKLITEEKVDALIGPTGSPHAMSVIQFVSESQTPMLAPTGAASVVLPMTPEKKWVFKTTQNTDIIVSALVDHMARTGVKTVGFVGLNDAFGEDWLNVVTAMTKEKGIRVTAVERFARTDNSVTGQALKILAANPDAVVVAAPGGPSVLPQTTLVRQGYKGKFYQSSGAALPDFLRLGGKDVEGTILAASLMLVLDEVGDSHPSKPVAIDYIKRYKALHGTAPATFGANVYDAGLLLAHAIPLAARKGKPGTVAFRRALRDELEQVKELVATQGVYTMTPENHSGFDERGRELITVKDGQWRLVQP